MGPIGLISSLRPQSPITNPLFTNHQSPLTPPSPMHRASALLLSALFLISFLEPGVAAGSQPSPTSDDINDLLGYLTGSYFLIGKELDGEKTFLGKVIINRKGTRLQILRTVNGTTVEGVGRIEVAPLASSRVLRIRFKSGNSSFEGTYLYHSDLDNYPRITGYLYKVNPKTGVPIETKKPGLETLFPEAPLKQAE